MDHSRSEPVLDVRGRSRIARWSSIAAFLISTGTASAHDVVAPDWYGIDAGFGAAQCHGATAGIVDVHGFFTAVNASVEYAREVRTEHRSDPRGLRAYAGVGYLNLAQLEAGFGQGGSSVRLRSDIACDLSAESNSPYFPFKGVRGQELSLVVSPMIERSSSATRAMLLVGIAY